MREQPKQVSSRGDSTQVPLQGERTDWLAVTRAVRGLAISGPDANRGDDCEEGNDASLRSIRSWKLGIENIPCSNETTAPSLPCSQRREARVSADCPKPRQVVAFCPQAGLLAHGSIETMTPSRSRSIKRVIEIQWIARFLAEYSSGPASDSHRLPFSPPNQRRHLSVQSIEPLSPHCHTGWPKQRKNKSLIRKLYVGQKKGRSKH